MVICRSSNPATGETGHFYERDGTLYPSVTTILDAEMPAEKREGLDRWRRRTKNWREIQKKSQIVGTVGHFRVLNSLADRTIELPEIPVDEYPPDLGELVEIVSYLWDRSGFAARVGYPRKIETTLISDRYQFAGKPDLRCPLMGDDGKVRLAVVDLKTSPVVREEYLFQLAAYGLMMQESPDHNRFPDVGVIVNLCPFTDKNPYLEPAATEFKQSVLLEYAAKFIEMTENYHARFGEPR